ncbi:MAG: efflux RND transporter periplasmic adaptor subunit [Lachnospiraceae bacterium]|nr:efflux RND transporter periplasmic adaptor subunit [Lachnospiraceae bacterium]
MFGKKKNLEAWETETVEEEGKKKLFSFLKKGEPGGKPEKPPLTKEQKKKRRRRVVIGSVAVVIVGFNIGSRLFAPEVLPAVNVVEASVGTVEQTIEGSGTVKSEEVKTYFSPVTAKVESFDLQVGDTVTAGDTLLTYDGAELDELYRQAELTGSAANLGYQDAITRDNENVSEYNRSSADLNVIEQQLDAEKNEYEHVQDRITEYTEKQANSSIELNNRQIALETAQIELKAAQERQKELPEELKEQNDKLTASPGDAAIQAEIEKLKAEQAALPATIAAATKKRDEAQKKIQEEQDYLNEINEKLNGYRDRLEKSSENLEKLQTNKAKEESIKSSTESSRLTSAARQELAANNNLSTLNAQMTKDDINAGKAGIQAEFSGVVTEVGVVPGGPAAQGSSLFTVASNENVIVDMSVTRFDLEKLEVGQSAEITLAGNTYTGTVSKLSRLAANNEKGTPVVSAQIHIDNPDDKIYLGLEAKVKISGRKAEDVIAVPVEAVNTSKEGSFCYIVDENGMIARKDVETGLSSATMIEIKSGLSFGDKVVRNTGSVLEEGMRVTAVEE